MSGRYCDNGNHVQCAEKVLQWAIWKETWTSLCTANAYSVSRPHSPPFSAHFHGLTDFGTPAFLSPQTSSSHLSPVYQFHRRQEKHVQRRRRQAQSKCQRLPTWVQRVSQRRWRPRPILLPAYFLTSFYLYKCRTIG